MTFDEQVEPELPKLRRLLRRLVGDPQDAADLLQETLLRAFTRFDTFRGESALSTWLYAIATRIALDYLRTRTLDATAKLALKEHTHAAFPDELASHFQGSAFDAREHIAFCFGCVSRSLAPEQQAALVLRDVMELSNDEAAKVLDVTTSVLRHHLAAARAAMEERYHGLCRLVSKTGACWQCEGLRSAFADGGPPVPELPDLRVRLQVVRDADPDGPARAFHAFLWRALATLPS